MRLVWDGGGTADLVAIDGDRLELVSSRAHAPGSRPKASLEGQAEGSGASGPVGIWMKVHGSQRQADGLYLVKGRLLNATRELRGMLEAGTTAPKS